MRVTPVACRTTGGPGFCVSKSVYALRVPTNAYMNAYMKKRYAERRAIAIQLLGGKCVHCGSTENLEFDHIDRTKKSFEYGSLWSGTWEKFLAELAKAQLLCKSCHLKKTRSELGVPHGGGKSGRRNCKCEPCRKRKAEYMKQYRRKTL